MYLRTRIATEKYDYRRLLSISFSLDNKVELL